MKVLFLVVGCALWTVESYPYYPYYGNMDSMSYGASDSSRGGVAYSRYYNPYYLQPSGTGMAAFMFKQPEELPQTSQYYLPDRRRQTQPELTYLPPQQNEVYPQQPQPATEPTELAEPTERTDLLATTAKAVPEITEPEIEEVEEPIQKPKKRLQKKKQVKRPVEDEDDDDYVPKMPAAAFFPMFFSYGGRSESGGMPGGATAIANAYSTARGGVASSHATAYGAPRPDSKMPSKINPAYL